MKKTVSGSMLSPKLLAFVDQLNKNSNCNIILRDRCSSDSWVYDGTSIALRKNHFKIYLDHDILHEVGHYVFAHPDQLLFPEYGLALGLVDPVAFGPRSGEFRDGIGRLKHENINNVYFGLIPDVEQNFQEILSQFFCLDFGPKLELNAQLYNEHQKMSWETYYTYKESGFTEEIKSRYYEWRNSQMWIKPNSCTFIL